MKIAQIGQTVGLITPQNAHRGEGRLDSFPNGAAIIEIHHHIERVVRLKDAAAPLPPAAPYIPLAYHGAVSSIRVSDEMVVGDEGCLSVPTIYDAVQRHAKVTVRALDRNGQTYEMAVEGLAAVCVQHEMDHLDGTLFVDRLRGLQKDLIVRKIRKLTRAGKW